MQKPLLDVACVQLRSSDEVGENIETASMLVRRAQNDGARFIATPEMTSLMDRRPGALALKARAEKDDEALKSFQLLAGELDIWLLIGSLPIWLNDKKCANRSFLITPEGTIAARYDKIHMFDVELGLGQTYKESDNYTPGEKAVVADVDGACVGMSVCYDLRFAYLYRALAKAGADILTIPSAFTHITGEAHWHVLLRARAIETGSFVMAPAQGGQHADGRETFGHSLIIGPWGDILAEAHADPTVIHATLDLDQVRQARRRIPALTHDRSFTKPAKA